MFGRSRISDKDLAKKITRRLERAGMGSQSGIKLTVRNGQVTLSGSLKYGNQRQPTLTAASGVEGVRTIVDQLQAKPMKKQWGKQVTKARQEPLGS